MNNMQLHLNSFFQTFSNLNLGQIAALVGPITLGYITGNIINNRRVNSKICNDFLTSNNFDVLLAPEVKYKYTAVDNRIGTDYYKYIIEFVNLLHNNFNKNNLAILHHNLRGLKVIPFEQVKKTSTGISDYTVAVYDIDKNVMALGSDYEETIFHELFHVASTYNDEENGVVYSGFLQTIDDDSLGLALAEGYTQLLTERYFSSNHKVLKSYDCELKASYNVEMLVGQNKMENLYLGASLFGLINSLSLYNSSTNVYNFVNNLDLISRYYCNDRLSKYAVSLLLDKFMSVKYFLLESFFCKSFVLFRDGLSDSVRPNSEEFDKFYDYLPFSVWLNDKKYYIEDIERYNMIRDKYNYYSKSLKRKLNVS